MGYSLVQGKVRCENIVKYLREMKWECYVHESGCKFSDLLILAESCVYLFNLAQKDANEAKHNDAQEQLFVCIYTTHSMFSLTISLGDNYSRPSRKRPINR